MDKKEYINTDFGDKEEAVQYKPREIAIMVQQMMNVKNVMIIIEKDVGSGIQMGGVGFLEKQVPDLLRHSIRLLEENIEEDSNKKCEV